MDTRLLQNVVARALEILTAVCFAPFAAVNQAAGATF